MAICIQCNSQIETPGKEGLCYGCYLDGLIPDWYQGKERYHHFFDPMIPSVATCHPKTGIELLDRTPKRLSQIVLPKSFTIRRGSDPLSYARLGVGTDMYSMEEECVALYEAGWSQQDIADKLRIHQGTVSRYIRRARRVKTMDPAQLDKMKIEAAL